MPGVSLSTEAVWAELHASIRGFVARRVRQQADVDDVVQRVFLQVHRALPTLRETDKLHAWVYQTTRRAIADFYRTPSQNREMATGTAEDIANELAASDSPEDDEVATRELSTCLKPLMSGLCRSRSIADGGIRWRDAGRSRSTTRFVSFRHEEPRATGAVAPAVGTS